MFRIVALLCGGVLGLVGAIVLWSQMSTNNPAAEWKVSNDGRSVSIENREANTPTRTIISCSATQPGGRSRTIYNYHGGNALVTVNEEKRPIPLRRLAPPGNLGCDRIAGVNREFQTSAHYVTSEMAWVLDPLVPVDFMDLLAQGGIAALLIR